MLHTDKPVHNDHPCPPTPTATKKKLLFSGGHYTEVPPMKLVFILAPWRSRLVIADRWPWRWSLTPV